MTNRIWIELEKPENDEHAHEQCQLANKMLKRLGLEVMEFWWGYGGKSITYNLTLNDSGMYLVCADKGHWFNLDKLAGE
jgi:hypothetical protein